MHKIRNSFLTLVVTILVVGLSIKVYSGSWQVLPNSPLAPYYHHDDIMFINENIGWLCNISGQIFKTYDGGDNWTLLIDTPGTSFRCIDFADSLRGWCGNLGPGDWVNETKDKVVIYSTINGGTTWNPVTNITGPKVSGICGIQVVNDSTIYGVGRYDSPTIFIKSTDGGASWQTQDMKSFVSRLVDIHFFTPDSGYVSGGGNGGSGEGSKLLLTTDAGNTWTEVINVMGWGHFWKTGWASETFGYASIEFGNEWAYTQNGGQTWNSAVFQNNYEANGIGFLNENLGWIGGEFNTLQTTDVGQTWTSIKLDDVYDDRINRWFKFSDSVIYACGMRVYKYSPLTVGEPKRPEIDNSKCALKCSPNPFDNSTTITYTVPEEDHVLVSILDFGGRNRVVLVDEKKKPGTYEVKYIPEHYLGEFLLCNLMTGRYRKTIKLVNTVK